MDYNIVFPKVTVLMPVYNCELYIKEAIDSILNQTFSDFEFLIIDDASTDATVSIIKEYNDSRIQLIEKPKNSGYTNSLNYGLSIAKGEYIARMDGDDISLPTRFEKQVAFLDANLDVVLCGTNFSFVGTEKVINTPEKSEEIKIALLKGNCIAHPSVMFRKGKIKENSISYDPNMEPAEDYDLWVRLLGRNNLYNLQEVLLNYRVHNTQVSEKRKEQQRQSALNCRIKMLKHLDCNLDKSEILLLKKMMLFDLNNAFVDIEKFFIIKEKLILCNKIIFFSSIEFEKYLIDLQNDYLKRYFLKREKYFPMIYVRYLQIKNKNVLRLNRLDELKLLVKSIVFYKVIKSN